MKQYNFLNESIGEYEDIDSMLSSLWGSFKIAWHRYKANCTFFKSCKELPKESNILKSVLKGLDIKVYAYPDADRNAFVIPGFYVGADLEFDTLCEKYRKRFPKHNHHIGLGSNFFTILMSSQLEHLIMMRSFTINNDPKKKGKKQAIFKNVNTPISVFVTYGMLNNATPEQRLGIYLHEIGHWIDAAKNIPPMMLKYPDEESCHLYYAEAFRRFCTRYEELEADRFAKILGYGQELISGLDSITNIRKQISLIYRWGDYTLKSAVEHQNKAEEEGMTGVWNYPSMKTRKDYLSRKD